MTDILTGLVWPDGRPATDQDRDTAAKAVQNAAGRIPGTEEPLRLSQIANAERRGDLRFAVRDLPDGVPPRGLTLALGIVSSLVLLMTLIQVTVWLLIGAGTGGLDAPWWLYSTIPGIVIAGVLWTVNESFHRGR